MQYSKKHRLYIYRMLCIFIYFLLCTVSSPAHVYSATFALPPSSSNGSLSGIDQSGINPLPGTEITPEKMQEVFPTPLPHDAPHMNFMPHAAPLIPIVPLQKSPSPDVQHVRNHMQGLPDSQHSGTTPPPTPAAKPQAPSSGAEAQPIMQLPLTMPAAQGIAAPPVAGTHTVPPQQTRPEKKSIPTHPTVEVMVGQMIMAGFSGTDLATDLPQNALGTSIMQLARQGKVGGVFLQPVTLSPSTGQSAGQTAPRLTQGNMTSPAQTRQLTATLQRAASESDTGIPLFISVVQEGGLEQSLSQELGFEGLAAAAHLGRGSVEATEIAARRNGLEMAGLGINFAFGPAGDVNINPLSEDIGKRFRSFGSDPQMVAQHVAAFGRGLFAARVVPCMRNYPGTGSFVRGFALSTANANAPNLLDGLPDVGRTWQNVEMIPYSWNIQHNWPGAIQPALAYVRSVDPLHPAPLSRTLIGGILRGQLAFDGLVVTQDLRALQPFYSIEESVVQAVLAGADIVFVTEPVAVPPQSAASPMNLFQNSALGTSLDMGLGSHAGSGMSDADQVKGLLQQALLKNLPGNMGSMFGAQLHTRAATGEASMAARAYNALLKSVRDGRIPLERIRASWQRIVRVKQNVLY